MLLLPTSCWQRIYIRAIAAKFKRACRKVFFSTSAIQEVFKKIYIGNEWRGSESISGTGSSLEQTIIVRAILPSLVKKLGCNVILDAPCGDFNWLSTIALDVKYLGCDIVEPLIESNQTLYGSSSISFFVSDITADSLPKVDLVLCRDCLVHLSNDDIFIALSNIIKSGAKYLLTTTFPDRDVNTNIRTGDWRTLNLQLAPFFLPTPTLIFNENCTESNGIYKDKSIALWDLRNLRSFRKRS